MVLITMFGSNIMTGIDEQFDHKPNAFGLSKSSIAAFEQCPRRL